MASDNLSQLGKQLNKTKKAINSTTKNVTKNHPVVEEAVDMFGTINPFKFEFKTYGLSESQELFLEKRFIRTHGRSSLSPQAFLNITIKEKFKPLPGIPYWEAILLNTIGRNETLLIVKSKTLPPKAPFNMQFTSGVYSPTKEKIRVLSTSIVKNKVAVVKAPVVWKGLMVFYKNTDITYQKNGATYTLKDTIPDAWIQQIQNIMWQFSSSVNEWSYGNANIDLTFRIIDKPLTSLTKSGDWYAIQPVDMAGNMGGDLTNYDFNIGIFSNPNEVIPMGGLAVTGSNVTSINYPQGSQMFGGGLWSSTEVFVHEWLHTALDFYNATTNCAPITSEDLDRAGDFGYTPTYGSWNTFLSDVMTNKIIVNGKPGGISPDCWALGTPRTKANPYYTINLRVSRGLMNTPFDSHLANTKLITVR